MSNVEKLESLSNAVIAEIAREILQLPDQDEASEQILFKAKMQDMVASLQVFLVEEMKMQLASRNILTFPFSFLKCVFISQKIKKELPPLIDDALEIGVNKASVLSEEDIKKLAKTHLSIEGSIRIILQSYFYE